jgi:hypothetical protein
MVDIRNYLKMSSTAKSIVDVYSCPEDFLSNYRKILEKEKKSYLRHFIINNQPYAFNKSPLIYEQIVQYFADNIDVNPAYIKLIGSAKTGFSISQLNYGRPYENKRSDLDFSIVNEDLFNIIQKEFELWAILYQGGNIEPAPNKEKDYWPQNLITGPKQIKRGFIDIKYIPNREQFSKTRNINSSLFYIKKYLAEIHTIEAKAASARIYKSWSSFSECLKYNTEDVLNKIK